MLFVILGGYDTALDFNYRTLSLSCRDDTVSTADPIQITSLIDDAKCFELIRQYRWQDGVCCTGCSSKSIVRNGHDDTQPHRQRYLCKNCGVRFDDLTDTVFAGHHQPLRMWVLCLYLMGLNLSNNQIAQELGLNQSDVQMMTSQLREGLTVKAPAIKLSGIVEADEVYVVAGHKGNPEAVKKKAGRGGVEDSRARVGVVPLKKKSRRS
jgi:transposase-like protein